MSVLMLLIGLAAVLFLIMISAGVFWFLVQVGVIAQKAMEPPATDAGNYGLDQGREVGKGE